MFYFIDGHAVEVSEDACRGCYIEKHRESLPIHLKPVIENAEIAVRQDAEFPVPGFYIISLRRHIQSIADVDGELAAQLGLCVHYVRKGMKECLGINRAHIYLEEKIVGPHYHTWLLPLWEDVMEEHDIDPKIWLGNVKKYIDLFQYEQEKDKILLFNQRLREYLMGIDYISRNFY